MALLASRMWSRRLSAQLLPVTEKSFISGERASAAASWFVRKNRTQAIHHAGPESYPVDP